MKGLPTFVKEFCLNMVTKTIEHRETTGEVRQDLMQYLIQLRNNSSEIDDWNTDAIGIHNMTTIAIQLMLKVHCSCTDKEKKAMSFEHIAAQVFVFYIAGNETSTSTIAYTLYELSQNVDLMARAQRDIEETLQKHNGQLTYESMGDMQFIELCIKETLRKYPFPLLNRQAFRFTFLLAVLEFKRSLPGSARKSIKFLVHKRSSNKVHQS